MIPPIRLVRLPASDDSAPDDPTTRCALVSVEAAGPDAWMVRVAQGPSFEAMPGGTAYGPYPSDKLPDGFGAILEQKIEQGYIQTTAADLIARLASASPNVRARAAVRLGWRKSEAAIAPLLTAAARSKSDVCVLVEALGRIGNPQPEAVALARSLAERKNLSRRRSGVEALRLLGDHEGLEAVLAARLARLPQGIRSALASLDETKVTKAAATGLEAAIAQEDTRRAGLIADSLYERATPLTNRIVRRWLSAETLREPHQWRYAKSILKRAMLRDDALTFGKLAYLIERASIGYAGTTAVVTSGFTGEKESTTIFGKKTQMYVRRATWRYLRDLARYRPDRYVEAASEVLTWYRPDDASSPKGLHGAFSNAYLLQRIIFGNSRRLETNGRNLKTRFVGADQIQPSPGAREEPFPQLWDAYPAAFLRIATKARLYVVTDFAIAGLRRHPDVIRSADLAAVLDLARHAREQAAALARAEIERRLAEQGWPLASVIVPQAIEGLRETVIGWLTTHLDDWATTSDRVAMCLQAPDPKVRAEAARMAAVAVASAEPDVKSAVADTVLPLLKAATLEMAEPLLRLCREALLETLDGRFSASELLGWIREGGPGMQQLGGLLLEQRPDAFDHIGPDGLFTLVEHELVRTRSAGLAILRGIAAQPSFDPSLLYALAESTWADTRRVTLELLSRLPEERMGVDEIIGLCDSTLEDVRALGRSLLERRFAALPDDTVLFRLAEHPAQDMRAYTMGLLEGHLRPGLVSLARIEYFVRTTLFDVRPRRALKARLLAFLRDRGVADTGQAELVGRILEQLLRTQTVFDFQRVTEILVAIQVRFPEVKTDLRILAPPVGKGAA